MADLQAFDGDGGNRTHARFPPKPGASGWFVYFVQFGDDGPIKIGRARNVERRMAEFQTGCPEELHVLGVIPGGQKLERGLHGRLERYRIRGEWFSPALEVLAHAHYAGAISGRYSCEVADWQVAEEYRYRMRQAGLWEKAKRQVANGAFSSLMGSAREAAF